MTITTTMPIDDAGSASVDALVTGVGHIAVNTADLDRFRRFYEGILGIPLGVVMRMPHPPHLRHAFFHIAPGVVLHAFEVPGYDPTAQGFGSDIGERGRIDHFALKVADEAALRAVAGRLRTAGSSDGVVQELGPMLSVYAVDPDGLPFEVTSPNLSYDAGAAPEDVEEVGVPDWVTRLSAVAGA